MIEPVKAKAIVKLNERSLMRRINRFLKADSCQLIKNRPSRAKGASKRLTLREYELGRFFVVRAGQVVVEHHVDLEEFARRYGIIKPYEGLEAAGT
jgi:hypothetical protein